MDKTIDEVEVEFTEFVRPNALQRPMHLWLPAELEEKVEKIEARGWRLTIEKIYSDEWALVIDWPAGEEDLYMELASNYESIEKAATKLINRAAEGL